MEWRERRVAQIVRDFMEAYVISAEIGAHLRAGDLDFERMNRLVGESEETALHRLKEESHALFRFDPEGPQTALQAEKLFDLAVGALFHEAMKFRESYYMTTSYGPRFESMMTEGSSSWPVATAFRRVVEAGRQRMLDSEMETQELFDETRDQLLILLREMSESGLVARSLVEDPGRTEQVFGIDLRSLLESIYGSTPRGYRLAIQNLVDNGHFAEASALLAGEAAECSEPFCRAARPFAEGMERFYRDDLQGAVEALALWVGAGAEGPDGWQPIARRALIATVEVMEAAEPTLAQRARELADALKPAHPA